MSSPLLVCRPYVHALLVCALLAAGALLVSVAMISRCPASVGAGWRAMAPIWLQLAFALLLTCVMPAPVVAWFRTVAAG